MKRIFQHPPEPATGRSYWRGLDELSDTPEFREWLEHEFPGGASELNGEEWSRRGFLKIMGASMALAGVGLSSCRRPESHLVPFTKSAEWTIPGKSLFYATAMPRRTGGIPLVITTHDGRPTKVDGNPLYAATGGTTDLFAQASILELYDPARSKHYIDGGKYLSHIEFGDYLGKVREQFSANDGQGLAFIVEESHSPTRERLRGELKKIFPAMHWCVYEPSLPDAQQSVARTVFGETSRVVPRLERADVIVALDSDFLDCGESDIAITRGFTSRRRINSAKETMNRLYMVENRFTLTGSMADHRLRCPASQIPAFAYALAKKLAEMISDGGLSSVLTTLAAPPTEAFDDHWITEAARDLAAKPGASLVLAGPHQAASVQLLVQAMNAALKNVGGTMSVLESDQKPGTVTLAQLAEEIRAGQIKQLFIFGGDPVFNAPRGLAQDPTTKKMLDWGDLQKTVRETVRLGYYQDATSELSRWHVPQAHYLEGWGDALTAEGSYLSIQPMILPLFNGLTEIEVMNLLLDRSQPKGPELVQETFRATNPPGDFETAWTRFLRDGFASHLHVRERSGTPDLGAAGNLSRETWSQLPAPTAESPEIVFVPSYAIDDGRYINNGWLQELPDPITKLTWDNAALISPAFAKHLGVQTGDLLQITITEAMRDINNEPVKRELVIAALISPGHADNSVTISMGYGRKTAGATVGGVLPYAGKRVTGAPAGGDAGFNAYFLRTAATPHFAVADGKTIENVSVRKTAGTYPLSITQDHWSIEGRGLVREATLENYRQDPEFVEKFEEELPKKLPSLYSHPPLTGANQWGMAVDLNVCTGCSACVIACQSENNIPIVGKLQVSHGRAMHWMRIDRYFASEKNFDQDRGEWPEHPEVVHQPVMCQHCENAPCETVCPVNATVHSEDGLNVMAYNRCVGTRYCANNCPFKVRRFNFFDYNQRPVGKKKVAGAFSVYSEYFAPLTKKGTPDLIRMQKNPNVTVRMRGVMEKCTYCVQRIEEAKIAAHVHAGASSDTRIPRDSFTSACAQACPNDAIVFGDISDPESRVSKMKAQDRNYRLLQYLNVNTRTSYLARIRNPNPKMPDAAGIGVASPMESQSEKPSGL